MGDVAGMVGSDWMDCSDGSGGSGEVPRGVPGGVSRGSPVTGHLPGDVTWPSTPMGDDAVTLGTPVTVLVAPSTVSAVISCGLSLLLLIY